MKTLLATDALPVTHQLKIAHIESIKIDHTLTIVNFDLKQKKSPYFKKFFQVTPAVQEEANWDNDWFIVTSSNSIDVFFKYKHFEFPQSIQYYKALLKDLLYEKK